MCIMTRGKIAMHGLKKKGENYYILDWGTKRCLDGAKNIES